MKALDEDLRRRLEAKGLLDKYLELERLRESYKKVERFYASPKYKEAVRLRQEHLLDLDAYIEKHSQIEESALAQPFI